MPFSEFVRLTVALGTRAPDGSETEPDNTADEASVWPLAKGTAMPTETKAIANNRIETLRSLGIDRDPLPRVLRYR